MKKIFGICTVCVLALGLIACDPFHSSSSSDDQGRRQEITTVVQTRGVTGLEEGDVMFFNGTGNKRVIATRDTRIIRQTSSCSAFDNATANEIRNGDTLVVHFFKNNSFFEHSRHVIRATKIEAFRAECIGANSERDLTPCQLQEILNNGAPCPFSGGISGSETGRNTGPSNGFAITARFSRPGAAYGSIITVTHPRGTTVIPNGSQRVETSISCGNLFRKMMVI